MTINVCKSAKMYRKEICHEGNGGVEKRIYSLSLYFYVFHAMELLDKVRNVLRFLAECLSPIDCNGKTG